MRLGLMALLGFCQQVAFVCARLVPRQLSKTLSPGPSCRYGTYKGSPLHYLVVILPFLGVGFGGVFLGVGFGGVGVGFSGVGVGFSGIVPWRRL